MSNLNRIQRFVLAAFYRHPEGMTDQELFELPTFMEWTGSTIRTRRSEITKLGLLIYAGEKKNSRQKWATVHKITELGKKTYEEKESPNGLHS